MSEPSAKRTKAGALLQGVRYMEKARALHDRLAAAVEGVETLLNGLREDMARLAPERQARLFAAVLEEAGGDAAEEAETWKPRRKRKRSSSSSGHENEDDKTAKRRLSNEIDEVVAMFAEYKQRMHSMAAIVERLRSSSEPRFRALTKARVNRVLYYKSYRAHAGRLSDLRTSHAYAMVLRDWLEQEDSDGSESESE